MNCICTLYDNNFKSFMPYVLKTFDGFAAVHGFDTKYFEGLIDSNLAPSWNKLLAILSCFDNNYDWVFWADADSLFIGKDPNLVYSSDFVTFGDANGLCMSHMLIRNTPRNRILIETLLFLGDVIDDSKFGVGKKWEQNSLKALKENFSIETTRFPFYYVGEPLYPDTLHPTNEFLHFAVMSNEQRALLISKIYGERFRVQ